MPTILDKIVVSKRREIEQQRRTVPEGVLEQRLAQTPPVRNFKAALRRPNEVAIIAEVKKASPSAGVLRADFDPVAIARIYSEHGAAAISVLTDAPFFQGELAYLSAIRQAVNAPVLRKDFILDRYQILEARAAGADAVLLIAEVLRPDELLDLLDEARRLEMQALVELHDADNLQRVIDSGAEVIGINNRNLNTFETRLEHTLELAENVPRDRCLVSESGIKNHKDIERLREARIAAVLIGETLMRAENIGVQLMQLRGDVHPKRASP